MAIGSPTSGVDCSQHPGSSRIEISHPAIVRWLESLPTNLRESRDCCLQVMATDVVIEQLVDARAATTLHDALEIMSELALDYVTSSCNDAFARLMLDEPRLVELGLVIVGAQLSRAPEIPRDQEFYPAVLLHRDVLVVLEHQAERDQPAVDLLWRLVVMHDPMLLDELGTTTRDIALGFSKGTRWPRHHETMVLRRAIARVRHLWETLASQLIVSISEGGGALSEQSVEGLARPHSMLRVERAQLVGNINRPRPKECPEALVRSAMLWPLRADRILGNLEGIYGVSRLHMAYVGAVWTTILTDLKAHAYDAATLQARWGEIIARDLAYPIAFGTEPLVDVSTFFERATEYAIHKKRLSRQRERCLRKPLEVIESEWMAVLDDIQEEYFEELLDWRRPG